MIYQVYRAQAEFLDLVRPLAAATVRGVWHHHGLETKR